MFSYVEKYYVCVILRDLGMGPLNQLKLDNQADKEAGYAMTGEYNDELVSQHCLVLLNTPNGVSN